MLAGRLDNFSGGGGDKKQNKKTLKYLHMPTVPPQVPCPGIPSPWTYHLLPNDIVTPGHIHPPRIYPFPSGHTHPPGLTHPKIYLPRKDLVPEISTPERTRDQKYPTPRKDMGSWISPGQND